MTYRPPFVSEREIAHTHQNGAADNAAWEDCVFCSGLMLANAATLGRYPATLTEAENIRDAAGASPTGSTTNDQLALGLSRRYGWTPKRFSASMAALLAATPVGSAAAFAGSFAGFAAGHRLRRWQPNYVGGHEVFASHEGPDSWRWMDPLASLGYLGDQVTDAEIRTFLAGNTNGGVAVQIGSLAPAIGETMLDIQRGTTFPVIAALGQVDLRTEPSLSAPVYHHVTAAEDTLRIGYVGSVAGTEWRIVAYAEPAEKHGLTGSPVLFGVYVRASDIWKFEPAPVIATVPPDVEAAIKSATDPLNAKIVAAREALK